MILILLIKISNLLIQLSNFLYLSVGFNGLPVFRYCARAWGISFLWRYSHARL